MTNYFGKARLKKIFYSYISKSPEKEKAFKRSEKEQRAIAKEYGRSYTNEIVFHYSKCRGSEWLECGDDERIYKIGADGATEKVVTIDEYVYNENDDIEQDYTRISRIVSYYSEDFRPNPQNKDKSLDCYDVAKKISENAEVCSQA